MSFDEENNRRKGKRNLERRRGQEKGRNKVTRGWRNEGGKTKVREERSLLEAGLIAVGEKWTPLVHINLADTAFELCHS